MYKKCYIKHVAIAASRKQLVCKAKDHKALGDAKMGLYLDHLQLQFATAIRIVVYASPRIA